MGAVLLESLSQPTVVFFHLCHIPSSPSVILVTSPERRLTVGILTPLLSGALAEADRSRIAEYRAEEEARIRRDGAPAQPVTRAEGCATDLPR